MEPCEAEAVTVTSEGEGRYRSRTRCGRDDARRYVIACEHEHLDEIWMCGRCAGGVLHCGMCFTSARPHKCAMRVEPVETARKAQEGARHGQA
jgi:hypothetical protein